MRKTKPIASSLMLNNDYGLRSLRQIIEQYGAKTQQRRAEAAMTNLAKSLRSGALPHTQNRFAEFAERQSIEYPRAGHDASIPE